MTKLEFVIPGEPVAWARARISRTGHHFTPKKARTREGIIASLAMDAMGGANPFSGPVTAEITAIFPIPVSWSKKRQAAALAGTERHCKKPDASNVLKLVEDALNGIAYNDDSQIVVARVEKKYGLNAQTVVVIRAI